MDPHLYALRAIPKDFAAHVRRNGCSPRELTAVRQRIEEISVMRKRLRKIERLLLEATAWATPWDRALRGRRYEDHPRAA